MAIGVSTSTDVHRHDIQLNHPNSALPMVPLGTLICGQPHTTPYSCPPTRLMLRMMMRFTLPPPPSGVRPIQRHHRTSAQKSCRSLQVLYPSWHCRVEGRILGLVGHQYRGWCTNVTWYKFSTHHIHMTTYRSCYTSIEAISSDIYPSLIVIVWFFQLVSASGGDIPPWKPPLPHYIRRGCILFPNSTDSMCYLLLHMDFDHILPWTRGPDSIEWESLSILVAWECSVCFYCNNCNMYPYGMFFWYISYVWGGQWS